MKDQDKTKDQLIQELAAMRQRMAELESAETERALIEDALREKTHLNQVLLDAFPCVALLLRPGTREVVASNQAAVEAGAVPGAQCYATWRQREDPCPWCLAPRACATGEAQRLEVDALDIVWDAHWIPVADDLYMHFAFDVTERVQTEAHRDAMLEALRESEEKLRAVLAAVPDLVIVLDAEGRYRDVFTAVPDLLVVPADQLLGKTVHDVMPREDAQPMQETINRALLSRGLERHEYSLEIDGARRWFVARVAALEYQGSDCVLWFARDITEHKQAEEEIKSAGRRWRLLLESIPSFAAEIDLEGRVIDVNKVQPGFSKADFVGRLVSEFAYPENLKQWQIAFSQVVESGVPATYEAPDYGPDRTLGWYHCHLAPVMEGDKVQSLILVLTDLTEHKRADEHLAYQAHLLANVNDAIVATDERFVVTAWNWAAEDIYGWKAEEALGQVVQELIPLELTDAQQAETLQAMAEHGRYRTQMSTYRKDGRQIYIEGTTVALHGEDGQVTGYVSAGRDVTERVQLESERDATLQALRESEERFRSIYSQSPIAIELYDPEGRLTDVNAACLDLFGVANVEAVKGFNLFEDPNVPGDAKQRLREGQAVEYESEFDFELVKKMDLYETTKSGRCYVQCLITPWGAAAQGQSGFLVHVRDITERMQADETLQESKNELQVLFDNMSNGFAYHKIVTDEAGVPVDYIFLEINRAFESYTGLKRDHIIGKRVTEVHPGIEKMEFDWIGKYGKVALGGEPITFEQYFEPQDHWYSIVAYSPVRGYFAVTFEDITERVQADEQLRASLKEKEALLRELYHRTKNNMQVISSILALQAARIQDEQMLSIFRETENRIRSMALVHQKLYQSQNLSRIDLQEYVTDLVALLMQSHEASPDKIALVLDTESVSVLIDTAIPCGLVLNELLSNTFKHAFPGDRSGEIKIQLCRAQDGSIEIKVSDDGVGVPGDLDLRKSDTLGMQMVFGIAERQLQGQVTVETEGGVAWRIRFKDDLYAPRV